MKKIFTLFSCIGFFIQCSYGQATLPTSWDFSNPSIATPPQGWTLNIGTVGNTTYSFGAGDNISCRLDNTGENVVIWIADKPGPISYYLSPQNAGAAWGGLFEIQESANGSTWTTVRSIVSKTTTATNFTGGRYSDNLQSTTRYVRFNFTTKLPGGQPTPGGNMALDSVLIAQGPPPTTPVFQLLKNGNELIQNSQYPMGNADSVVFYIKNRSTNDTLIISQADLQSGLIYTPAAFSVASTLPISIAKNDSAAFVVKRVSTGTANDKYVNVLFHTNDPDKTTFGLRLWAVEGNVCKAPTNGPSTLSLSGVSAYGFSINTTQLIPETIDTAVAKHLILIKESPITETPVDKTTYKKGMYIGAAKVISITSGITKPTYIFANKKYYIKVFSYRGQAGFEAYNTTTVKSDSIQTTGANPGAYYSGLDPMKTDFVTSLTSKLNTHDTVFYSSYASAIINNWLSRDTTNDKKVVNCVYTTIPYIYAEPFVWWNGNNSGTLTREHSYPQSWMPSNTGNFPTGSNGKEMPEYNDLHNLFPADQIYGNGVRSNYAFGEVVTASNTSPTGIGKLGKNAANQTVYEPADNQKGNAARALMYMAVCYHGINGLNWGWGTHQDTATLMKWHRQDPPDAIEIARNELIASLQHNRNPFIDNPDWANYINFNNVTYINHNPIPQLQITNPTNSVTWKENENHSISWTSSNMDSVRISFSSNAQTFTNLATLAAGTGMINWKVVYIADSLIFQLKDPISGISKLTPWIYIQKASGLKEINKAQINWYYQSDDQVLQLNLLNTSFDVLSSQVNIIDMNGKLVLSEKMNQESIKLPFHHKGAFVVVIQSNAGVIKQKIWIE